MSAGPAAVSIRTATRDDLPTLVTLWHEPDVVAGPSDSIDALQVLFEHDPRAVIVAVSAGDPVGVLLATWDGWRGNMYRLAVRLERRREGVARALVTEAERRLRARGCTRVSALVQDDEGAAALWLSCGYSPDVGVARHVKMLA